MASPRHNSTARRDLEQRQPSNLPMSATHVTVPPVPPTRIARLPHGPPHPAIPTYIPNPFEEYVLLRSTAELGPDPVLNRQPTSRTNLPEPGLRKSFLLYPAATLTLVSPAQSNEQTVTDSAGVASAAPLSGQGNRTLRLARMAPPGRSHTRIDSTGNQGKHIRYQQAAVSTDNMPGLPQRGQIARTRGADSSGQRGPTFPQPPLGYMNPTLSSNLIEQDVVYSSSPGAPDGETSGRASNMFGRSILYNSADMTTFAPQDLGRSEVVARTVPSHGPNLSTTTTYHQLPAQANAEVMQTMESGASLPQENFDGNARLEEIRSSIRIPSRYDATRATGSGGGPRMTAAEQHSLIEQQLSLARARIRALRATRRAPPAQIQHFSTLPTNDPTYEPECPICQEPYNDKEHAAIRLQKVNCTHVFGRSCLQQWMNSGMGNAHRCPSCRRDITAALSRAIPAAPLPTVNGTINPAHQQDGRSNASELTRHFQDAVYAQEELYQARRAHEEARPALGTRRVRAGFDASAISRQSTPSTEARQASEARRRELEVRRQEMEARRAEMTRATASPPTPPSDEALRTFEAPHPQLVLRYQITAGRLGAANPSRRTTREAPEASRESNAASLQMQNTLRSQAAELAAFDANAAHQTNTATASSHEEATALATGISRERTAIFRRHRDQIMSLTRNLSREDREREAEDEVLRR
jgi:hypothetical protein